MFYEGVRGRTLEKCQRAVGMLASYFNVADKKHFAFPRRTDITDLRPFSYLVGLTSLDLSDAPVTDFSPLTTLVNLNQLKSTNTLLKDFRGLSNLESLKEIELYGVKERLNLAPLKVKQVNDKPGLVIQVLLI